MNQSARADDLTSIIIIIYDEVTYQWKIQFVGLRKRYISKFAYLKLLSYQKIKLLSNFITAKVTINLKLQKIGVDGNLRRWSVT